MSSINDKLVDISFSHESLRLGTRLTNALNGCLAFNFFDDAIADLLCLRTYTHGTSPKCYHNIMKIGADPNHGGKGGESGLYEAFGTNHDADVEMMGEKSGWNCHKRFFAFSYDCPEPIKRWQPRIYSIAACVGENCHVDQGMFVKGIFIIASIIEGFCSPVLKFRFQKVEDTKFNIDETFNSKEVGGGNIAVYTEEAISPEHIGLYGSLSQGLNSEWKQRITQNAGQFAKGLLKLIISVGLVAGAILGAQRSQSLRIALLAYSAFKGLQILGRFFVPLSYEFTISHSKVNI